MYFFKRLINVDYAHVMMIEQTYAVLWDRCSLIDAPRSVSI